MDETIKMYLTNLLSNKTHTPYQQLMDMSEINRLNLNDNEYLELVYDLEDKYEIEFPAQFWKSGFENQFNTIRDIVSEVERLIQKKNNNV